MRTCGNDYDKAFEVTVAGKSHVFDSFECAIHALAPNLTQQSGSYLLVRACSTEVKEGMVKLDEGASLREALARLLRNPSSVSVLVLETFEKALDGFFSLDPQNCRSVVEASTLAGELINGLNEESVRLLTESYPDRTDVYHAISILRFSTCQEQVVSHAVSVVKRTQRLLRLTPRSEVPGLKPFAGDVFALLSNGCRMFLTNEPELGPLIRARHRSLEQFCAELKIY